VFLCCSAVDTQQEMRDMRKEAACEKQIAGNQQIYERSDKGFKRMEDTV
jgi:hypothetical protein